MQRHHAETQLNDPAALAVAMAAAGRRAGTLARRIIDPAQDREDHRQDILVDLISRAQRFDQARGSWGAFVTVVTRNAARGMLARHTGMITVAAAEVEALGDIAQGHAEAASAVRIDTTALLHRLPPSLLPVVMGVAEEGGVTDAQRASGIPAASFYRALRQLRLRLIAGGLAPQSFIDNRRLAASGR
jgi:DNA-directed RNA polymerase specialized sigma24 family protein